MSNLLHNNVGHQELADGASLDIKPGVAGEVWEIVEIGFTTEGVAEDIEIIRTNGSLPITLELSKAATTGFVRSPWRVSTASWIQVKNNSGETQVVSYAAVTVEEAS